MKHIKTLALLFMTALAIGLSSCGGDDAPRTALPQPNVTLTDATYQSLSFSWDKVEGAVQYGYRLIDPDGFAIDADVTQQTSVEFSGLQTAAPYTIEVWAFAAMDGDWSTPPAATLQASTAPLQQLATPVVTVSSDYDLTFRWEAVPDAVDYSYTITRGDGSIFRSGKTNRTSIQLFGSPAGDYTITVVALGHDGFSDSLPATATGTITR